MKRPNQNHVQLEDPEVAIDLPGDSGPQPLRLSIKTSTLIHIVITLITLITIFTTLRADVERLKVDQTKRQTEETDIRLKLDSISNKLDILNTRQMLFEQRVQELNDRFWEHQGSSPPKSMRNH